MATYYVRTTGSDANGGTDPDTDAWLTIDKAANTVAANDTVWIGAGVYREVVTMDTAGTSGNLIEYKGDVTGENTGDAGLVVISAYANETSAATRTECLDPNGLGWITWTDIVFTGGTSGTVSDGGLAGNRAYEGVVFTRCTFISGDTDADATVIMDLGTGAAPGTTGLQFKQCVFIGGACAIYSDLNASADVDADVGWENCIFTGAPGSGVLDYGVYINQAGGSGSFGVTGFLVNNCTFFGKFGGVYTSAGMTTASVTVKNCFFNHCRTCLQDADAGADAITSDYNTFSPSSTPYVNVTGGGNDTNETVDPGLIGGFADLNLIQVLGWSPYKPWEPIRLQDDSYAHAVIGTADTATAPATDFYGSPRPMHGTVDDRGAVEGRARPEKETSTVRTGSNAIRFEGAGFHDFFVPVAAQSTTITIYGRYDSSYTGSLPKLEVLNIPGVADKSDTMVAAANTWEQLSSAAFTPTAAGVCRVRISSQDTSASGESFFDDLVVT